MGPEPFNLRKSFDRLSYLVQTIAREFLDGYELDEIENAETATEAGLPGGGQNVVGAGGVIAHGLRRVVANEDGACVSNVRQVFARDGDVLGG